MKVIELSIQKNLDGSFSPILDGELVHTAEGQRMDLKTPQGALAAAEVQCSRNELLQLEAGAGANIDPDLCRQLREQVLLDEQDVDRYEQMPEVERKGIAALHRLFEFAQGSSGQCRYIAGFLLGCYNGSTFPYDLTNFRCLDTHLFYDCMAVLMMDSRPRQEVHQYFEDGSEKFQALAMRCGLGAP